MALHRNAIAELVGQAMSHDDVTRKGNKVFMVTYSKTGSDKDLGVGGSITPNTKEICPEPWLNAIAIDTVLKSNNAFMFSDVMMTMARESVGPTDVLDKHTEWTINGDFYTTISVTPGPSAWEIVIRRKTTSPVTP